MKKILCAILFCAVFVYGFADDDNFTLGLVEISAEDTQIASAETAPEEPQSESSEIAQDESRLELAEIAEEDEQVEAAEIAEGDDPVEAAEIAEGEEQVETAEIVRNEPNIYSYPVGTIEVLTLVETRRPGGIPTPLIDIDQELLESYFPDGTSLSETNTFLVRNGERLVLIDTGFGTTLFDNLKELDIVPEKIEAVMITHLHGDHFSGLSKDGEALFPKAKVYVAHAELEYWTKTNVNQGAVAALAPYQVKEFIPGSQILLGITSIAAFGHTPGHTMFMVESEGQKLLIAGDLVHVQKAQFPHPEISVTYDTDPAQAAVTRKNALNYAALAKIPIAGMHLLYPAIGNVAADGDGFHFIDGQ
jgi:glyoxylase-like metal-dependent hydrolase (beta-lactamase superfamily II)